MLQHGLVSAAAAETKEAMDRAFAEMESMKAEELPDFEVEWVPTLWRSYCEFGPSMENQHGHGGFLSPKNGACMTSGPLQEAENESELSPTVSGSRKGPGKRPRLTRQTAGHMKWVNHKWKSQKD